MGKPEGPFGFQIAMNDAECVRRGQGFGRLDGHIDELAGWERAAVDQLAERFSFDQLGDDVGLAVALPDVVDGHDIGMTERCEGARFLFEALAAGGIARHVGREHFDRDSAVQACIAGTPDLAHAAFTEFVENFVVA